MSRSSSQKQRLPPPGAELLLNEHCIEEQAHARVSLRTGPSTISYHVRSCQGKHKHGRAKQLPLCSLSIFSAQQLFRSAQTLPVGSIHSAVDRSGVSCAGTQKETPATALGCGPLHRRTSLDTQWARR